jgi:hypothetical protein
MSEVLMAEKAPTKKAATIYTEVPLSDGRTVKFAGDRKVSKDVLFDDANTPIGVQFDFRNGETRKVLLADLAAGLVTYSACHGLLQKVGDEWSGVKEVEDIVITADDIIGRLLKGDWATARESGDSQAGASIVIKAIMEASSKSAEEVKAFLDKKIAVAEAAGQKLTRQALYTSFRNPTSKVGAIIRRLEDERASKNSAVNADDLVNELTA